MIDLRERFIEGMSRAASSVSVVTTDGPAGRAGLTVSAMTSVSADGDQPTMLVCLNASASALPLVLENGCFCINVLEQSQQQLSNQFSGRSESEDRFSGVRHSPATTGAPRLIESLVSFDCRLLSAEKIGTHHVCIGGVEDVVTAPEGSPLLYGMRRYLRPEHC